MYVRLAAVWAAVMLIVPAAARADVGDYLGRRIAAVALEVDGRVIDDPRLTTLVQTHAGDTLAIAAIRESITHLFSLGSYEDIQVVASARGGDVAITYQLQPLKPIDAFAFEGAAADGVDTGRLRRLLAERFGTSPRANRTDEMARAAEEDLKLTGFLGAHVEARVSARSATHSTMTFMLSPGPRAAIGTIDVTGEAGVPKATLLNRLDLAQGRPYRRDALTTRLERFVESERRQGFFSARLNVAAQPVDEGRLVNLTITATRGPHVRIVFEGDAIPRDRQAELAPIAREASADEDLLEDSTIRIEEFLRAQGYRDAKATFSRREEGDELVISFTVVRGPQYRVEQLEVTGNTAFTLAQIQSRLRVRVGQPFSVAALNADLAALEDMYRREGFVAVEANPDIVTEPPIGDGSQVPVQARIRVSENVRTIVRSITIEGNRAVAEARLREGLGLQPGRPYFVTQLAIDRDAMQLQYANLGYQSVVVSTNAGVSPDGATADLRFTVVEGPRVFVDHVLIVGNERTRAVTIERELQFRSGDPLGLEAINESQRRLAALGLFRRARITEVSHGESGTRDVLVTVEEAPATTIGYGGGLQALQLLRSTNETGVATAELSFAPRAFFEVGRRNLFGKNRSVSLFTRVSLRPQDNASARDFTQYRIIGTFREPKAIGTGADAYLTGTLEQERRSSFNFSRRALNAQLGRKVTRLISVSGSYQIQRTEVFFNDAINPSEQLLIDRVFPQVRLSSFSLAGVRDSRDDLADPSTGTFLSANGQIAARRIGSEVGFAKTFMTAQRFIPVPQGHNAVLATSVRVGMAAPFPRDVPVTDASGGPVSNPDGSPQRITVRDLPASERFFAGGDTTVRGFALDQLGAPNTIDKDGFPIGGGGLVILNVELRLPIKGGFGVVGFVDAGNVFARTSEIDLGQLRTVAGFGVRYKSPIGPIRFDIGFKTSRREITPGNRESASALHISLGQAF